MSGLYERCKSAPQTTGIREQTADGSINGSLADAVEYIGIYVVAYHQVVEIQTLQWGLFFGSSLTLPGELHQYIPNMRGDYQHVIDSYHTPRRSDDGASTAGSMRYIAAHRVGELPLDGGSAYFRLLRDEKMVLKAGATGQEWTHAALDILENSRTGWIDVQRRMVLEHHLPRRLDPEMERYVSARGTICDLDRLDADDYVRHESVEPGKRRRVA